MLEPTPEVLSALEARHGAAMRLLPPLRVGLEQVRFAVRVFDVQTYDRYTDESMTATSVVLDNTFLRHVVWPNHETCAKLTMACASLPGFVVQTLTDHAIGATPSAPAVRTHELDATTSDAVLEVARLDRETAEKLCAQAGVGGVVLTLAVLRKGGGFVLRAPEPLIFEQLKAAAREKKGFASAARAAAAASTCWASEDVSALFSRLPGLPAAVVFPELHRLGGVRADSSFCIDD